MNIKNQKILSVFLFLFILLVLAKVVPYVYSAVAWRVILQNPFSYDFHEMSGTQGTQVELNKNLPTPILDPGSSKPRQESERISAESQSVSAVWGMEPPENPKTQCKYVGIPWEPNPNFDNPIADQPRRDRLFFKRACYAAYGGYVSTDFFSDESGCYACYSCRDAYGNVVNGFLCPSSMPDGLKPVSVVPDYIKPYLEEVTQYVKKNDDWMNWFLNYLSTKKAPTKDPELHSENGSVRKVIESPTPSGSQIIATPTQVTVQSKTFKNIKPNSKSFDKEK